MAKRSRNTPLSEEECCLLVEKCLDKLDLVLSIDNEAKMAARKNRFYDDLAMSLNDLRPGNNRTGYTTKKKWQNCMARLSRKCT